MPGYVFISHAKKDRDRICPILMALLAAGIEIWIDEPRKLGLHNHPLVKGIPAHVQSWSHEIESALKAASAVIVFWSRHAVGEERGVLQEEARFGRSRRMLIQLMIEPVIDELPLGFKQGQIVDLSADIPPPGQSLDIGDIIVDVRALLQRGPEFANNTPTSSPQPGAQFMALVPGHGASAVLRGHLGETTVQSIEDPLPYLVDRQSQRSMIVSELCEELSREHKARSCAFLMHCPPEERPDKFVDYLRYEVHGELQRNLGTGFDWTLRRLTWPSCGTRLNDLDFDAALPACLHAVSRDLHVGGAALVRDPRAFASHVAKSLGAEPSKVLFIHCDVQPDRWGERDEQLIVRFLRWWQTLPLDNVNTRPVLLLKLIGPRLKPRFGLKLFGSSQSTIVRFVQRLDPKQFELIRLVKLPSLDSIMAGDLTDWAESVFESRRAAALPHAAIVKQAALRIISASEGRKPLDEVSRLLQQVMANAEFAERLARGVAR